jgi:hypothetical protein
MSIVAMKRKTWSQKNLSGHGAGFSLNGSSRNIGFRDYQMSSHGTPFKGAYPVGHGGQCGNYYNSSPSLNVCNKPCDTMIKPSTVSTKGMLETKYKWIHGGQYPNYWVKDSEPLNATQAQYINDKITDNMCVTDTNKPSVYVGNDAKKGPTLCQRTTAGFTFNQLVSNAPYTKTLKQPMPSSQYQLYMMRNCVPILTATKYENYPNNPPKYC